MRLVPWRVQNFIRGIASKAAMPFARRWVALSPTRPAVALLRFAWNNDSFSADVDYLLAVAGAASRAEGPILECGSGITTLLIGLIAQRRGVRVFTLEHEAQWQAAAERMLKQSNVRSVRVIHAPLRSYGDYDWYTIPQELPQFSLVICDGPPGATRGGRYGLLPVVGRCFTEECTVLLDDAERPEEKAILDRWRAQFGFQSSFGTSSTGDYAVVKRAQAAAGQGPSSG